MKNTDMFQGKAFHSGNVGQDGQIRGSEMKIITGHFGTLDQARNAHEDLIDTGIPAEKAYLDREKFSVKVMMPSATEPEVREILGRHQPRELEAHDG